MRENTCEDESSVHYMQLRYLGEKKSNALDYPGIYQIYSHYSQECVSLTAEGLLALADLINERRAEIEANQGLVSL